MKLPQINVDKSLEEVKKVTQKLVNPSKHKETMRTPIKGNLWNPLKNWPQNSKCFCGSQVKFKKCCRNELHSTVPNEKVVELELLVKKEVFKKSLRK